MYKGPRIKLKFTKTYKVKTMLKNGRDKPLIYTSSSDIKER